MPHIIFKKWQKEKKSELLEDLELAMEELSRGLMMSRLNRERNKFVLSVVDMQKELQMVFGIVKSVERNSQEAHFTLNKTLK